MVFIIGKDGNPLMPTKRHRKVRLWLKEGKARVVRKTPFTIQLLFATGNVVSDVSVGVDIGFKTIGINALTKEEEFLSLEVELRTDVSSKVTERRMYRINRRNRER